MSSSVYADNNWEKGILILGKGPMQGVDDTTLTAKKKKCSVHFSDQHKKL